MAPRIMYLELKEGFDDNGPAWIGVVNFSKSGRTAYFNGRAFRSIGGQGIKGNHRDTVTGDEYWISGVKKDGNDRLWPVTTKTLIDRQAVTKYLKVIGRDHLDMTKFEVFDAASTDKSFFSELENRTFRN